MPYYFFHLRGDVHEILDPEGLELTGLPAAKVKAMYFARDMLSHDMKTGCIDLRYRLDVEERGEELVHSLAFGDAFEILH